jgi:hypothetical protein
MVDNARYELCHRALRARLEETFGAQVANQWVADGANADRARELLQLVYTETTTDELVRSQLHGNVYDFLDLPK